MPDSDLIPPTLLAGVREGREDAWRELVDLLSPQVFRIVRNQINRSADHEDVAQETFTKIFLKFEQFAGRQDFRHWVSRITINTCYDWLRKKKARPLDSYADLGEQHAEIIERTLAGENEAPDVGRQLMIDLLHKLIATLNPREQIVIRLLDLEEKSVQDVCDLTGWGASKVKVTAMRARRKLGEMLRKLEPQD
jgi:RNA polymerase sigma-70 factor (ECF subfamily)